MALLREQRARRLLWSVPVAAIAVFAFGFGEQDSHAEQFPLDGYPGWGRSTDAALRDDTIAYWEAFRRETAISSCMRAQGFEYEPGVPFPAHATIAIAQSEGVQPSKSPEKVPPRERNRKYEKGLATSERDRYTRAYVGESAADVEGADQSGGPPPGRGDDFAQGGCLGKARGSIGSVWDHRRKLSDEYDTMRRGIPFAPEFSDSRVSFRQCARERGVDADNPGDLEAIRADGGPLADEATAAFTDCMAVWRSGYDQVESAATQRFVEKHQNQFDDVKKKYLGVPDEIRKDQAVRENLGKELSYLKSRGVDRKPER